MADAKMKGVDGKEVTVADVAGKKGTLVVFTCNACPWVKKWERRIAEIGNDAREAGHRRGRDQLERPDRRMPRTATTRCRRARRSAGLKFPYVVDATSDVARAFGATRTPEAFLFDADGKLVYHGTIDDNANEPKEVKQRYLREGGRRGRGGQGGRDRARPSRWAAASSSARPESLATSA